MTRVIVVSDSHGAVDSLRWVMTHEKADALVFLGDGLRDLDDAMDARPKGLRVYRVRGNCDFGYAEEPVQGLCGFGGVLFFAQARADFFQRLTHAVHAAVCLAAFF